MPRYFFHIRTADQLDRDHVGREFRSLDEARAYVAEAVLNYVVTAEPPNLELIGGTTFEIRNEHGRRELVIPFDEALPIAKAMAWE